MPENELSKNIRRLRKKRQLTQEQLAAMVGVSAQAVSKWESGGYPDPSLLPAIALHAAFNLTSFFAGYIPLSPAPVLGITAPLAVAGMIVLLKGKKK